MLNIINRLSVFFEDCYKRVGVREYSRIMKISPPTASKFLYECSKKGLLLVEKDRNYIFYYANRESRDFIDLCRMYWRVKLSDLVGYLDKKLIINAVILFGSLSKGENKEDSDIDLCVIGRKKELDLNIYEKKLKRKIQIFYFKSINDIRNIELRNNILNGYTLFGRIRS